MRLFWQRVIYCVLMFLNIAAILAFFSYIIGLFWIDITKYEISSSKIPKSFNGYKILQLSDLHSRSVGTNNETLLKKIDAEKPNIIVITGDIVNTKDTDFSTAYKLAKSLTEKYPVYYIVGNHEQRLPLQKFNEILSNLRQNGVTVLHNQSVPLFNGADRIDLTGLTLPLSYYTNQLKQQTHKDLTPTTLKQFIGAPQKDIFHILLSHNPLYFETYASWGADLTLSGHIHGGIIRFPFIGGLLSPERTFFPKYSGGKYEIENSTLIVNRGIGNGTVNLRIFNNPEITVITLKNE